MTERIKVQSEISVKEEEERSESRWLSKSVSYIVVDISFERFCTAGILTILPLFLHKKLGLDDNKSTSIFHTFECLLLIFTIFGAILADTWLGLYRSVLSMSFLYILGIGFISVAMIETLNLPIELFVSIGLVILIVGAGSLKTNLNAFGGGQHKLPEQKKQLETYFSVQYFGVKIGSMLARVIFPVLREDVKCFGKNDCYVVTFGIPALIMILGTVIFLKGTSQYVRTPPNGNLIVKMVKCVKFALSEKFSSADKKENWLEYSVDKFGKKLVLETQVALKVILISLPVPIFWACLMQQRSRWIFQATKMDGDLGWYTIKPDQMIVINSLLAISLIPFLDKFIYPLLARFGIKTMLQRLIFGGCLIVVAVSLSVVIEIEIKKNFISILWQLPQFLFISIAEILTYLSHLNFAYKEAPSSMKSVMMCLLYLSMAGGDLIVAIVSASKFFESQALEFAFFAALMSINLVILSYLAHNYKHVDHETIKELEEVAKNNDKV